jgi:hypothetical protein
VQRHPDGRHRHIDDGGPQQTFRTAAERDAETDRQLAVASTEFPGWDFVPTFAGWLAVPAGTVVFQGMRLESVIEKLRARGGS